MNAQISRRRLISSLIFVVVVVAFLYFGLPQLVGFRATWDRVSQGDLWWLALAALMEGLSDVSYITLFRAVFVRNNKRIDWSTSYQITLASITATRALAAAGAGGIALTARALNRAGLNTRMVATRLVAFNVLLYFVYMATMAIAGLGLYFGLFVGNGPFAITVIPALFAVGAIILVSLITLLPGDVERIVARWAARPGHSWLPKLARRLAAGPAAAAAGVRDAIKIVRVNKNSLFSAIGAWGFDIASLWACFHAFGASPHWSAIILGYFVGWMANLLPLPGGIGGVEGGLIGAYSAFGINTGIAIVAVLAYRAFSFWFEIPLGGVAYLQLRRKVARWRTEDEAAGVSFDGPADSPADGPAEGAAEHD